MTECKHDFYYLDHCGQCGKSANEIIEHLEQENARLREETDRFRRGSEAASKYMDTQGDKIIALQQDNARLREELATMTRLVDYDTEKILRLEQENARLREERDEARTFAQDYRRTVRNNLPNHEYDMTLPWEAEEVKG